MTGAFQGSYRVIGVYQNESSSFAQTPYISGDFNFRLRSESNWISLGVETFQDQIGSVNTLNRLTAAASLAGHFSPVSMNGWIIHVGGGFGIHRESWNGDQAVLAEDIINGTTIGQTLINDVPNSSYLRTNLGFHLSQNFENRAEVRFGSSINFYSATTDNPSSDAYGSVIRYFTRFGQPINDQVRIIADFIGESHRSQSLIYISAMGEMHLPDYNYDLLAGLLYKTNGTWGLKAGFSLPRIDTSLEYVLGGADFGNSISLTFAYKGNLYKKIDYEPIYLCPTY